MFIGRDREVLQLQRQLDRKASSLIVCRGRRRIGKSRLIQEFSKKFDTFIEIQGLAPRKGIDKKAQLINFREQLSEAYSLKTDEFSNWTEAFASLDEASANGSVLILLDEISWMSANEPDFVGKLKIAWDKKFSKNANLMLVLCGSVTSWIDENILNGSDFMGRISLTLSLSPLRLPECNAFWGVNRDHTSSHEKLKVLSVIGGIPRYLELIQPGESADMMVRNMCFAPGGVLLNEFDHIFNDIFNAKATQYKAILNAINSGAKSFSDICSALGVSNNGIVSGRLQDLCVAGFVTQDTLWKINGKKSRLTQFRISDNYVRFYLKFIEPVKEQIQAGLYEFRSLSALPSWNTVIALQFENLVLNHIEMICKKINIHQETLISASPYFQNKTAKQDSCQCDLIIRSQHALYVCEIKFKKKISNDVIDDVAQRIEKLTIPKNLSLHKVLIYEGDLSQQVTSSGYFDHLIQFSDFL
jgi:hypothetical protein